MRTTPISVALVATLALGAGCVKTRACKAGTALATLTFDATSAAADTLTFAVTIGSTTLSGHAAHTPGSNEGTVEFDFPNGYPSGQPMSITLTASASATGQTLGTANADMPLSAGCTSLRLDVTASGGASDLGGDLAGVEMMPPLVAQPRLIAPLSTSSVTQQQPTLRWELGAGTGTSFVDLCKDRGCTTPISGVTAVIAGDNVSAKPSAALPAHGWVFWRVRVVNGSNSTTSATWQFWEIGRASCRERV